MPEYLIDDLARAAGTTTRNIRVYTERGLLPPPERRGRVGVYGDAHLARLRLIAQLLDRGFTFAHIAELIAAWQSGHDLAHVLGLETALTSPWSDEIPDYLTIDEVLQLFAGQVTEESTERAIAAGLIEPEGDRFKVPSPRLLHAGAELVAAGMPLDAVLDLAEGLARDIEAVAERFVHAVEEHLLKDTVPEVKPADEDLPAIAALITRLRPLAQMSVDAQLARAMERQTRAVLGERIEEILAAQRDAGDSATG